MGSYETMIKQIESEAKLLSDDELNRKITEWVLSPELKIYSVALENELKKRKK